MEVAIGGHHIATVVTTILILPHTVALTMEVTATIIQRLTMTPRRGPTAGNRRPMDPMDRRQEGPATILILGHMREALRFRRLTGAGVPRKPIIRTPAPMLRRGKA